MRALQLNKTDGESRRRTTSPHLLSSVHQSAVERAELKEEIQVVVGVYGQPVKMMLYYKYKRLNNKTTFSRKVGFLGSLFTKRTVGLLEQVAISC